MTEVEEQDIQPTDSLSPLDPQPPSFGNTLQRYGFIPCVDSSSSKHLTRNAALHPPPYSPSPRLKRKPLGKSSSPALSPSPNKRVKPSSGYAPPKKYAHIDNKLTDSLAPGLICVFIGVNPGITTATTGHAYSHASNLFWKLLHSSGCTPRRCSPKEDGDLPRLFAMGLTNIVTRPTKDASELSKAETDASVPELEAKISKCRPEAVVIVGKGIWESLWRVRHGRAIRKEEFRYGWQDDSEKFGASNEGDGCWDGAKVFVATTTSGLAAGMTLPEKEAVWRRLGEWVERRRLERVTLPQVETELVSNAAQELKVEADG